MLRTKMYLTKEELFALACKKENLENAVREANLGHLAYGRIDYYLELEPNHEALASVQKAGRGWLYVTYSNTSVYLQLTADGKIICEYLKGKEEAIIIAALVRVFILANYAINHRKVVVVAKSHRKNVNQKAADEWLAEQPIISNKYVKYSYASNSPNGKDAWQELDLVPIKSIRRGHFRHLKNGKTIWVKESETIVYRKRASCHVQLPPPIIPKEVVNE